jgi:myo-inositol-1(or 4)-monophosphatase
VEAPDHGGDARERTLAADWLGASRAAASALREVLEARPTTAERARETGTRGEGGDRTLEIDALAEDAVFAELERLHADGARFTAVSEERGEVDFGSDPTHPVIVVIDPIDGSMNAKRGLPHTSISIAVADGPCMGDVVFGFVYDFGPEEEWVARRGEGALLDGTPLPRDVPERRTRDGRLELLGFESADPRWVKLSVDALGAVSYRLRAIGTIAVALCQVAAARFDGMVTLRNCRAVDAAAAQLIVREAGGEVAFTACEQPLGAPLDLAPRSPVVAARTPEGLAQLVGVPVP